MPYKVTFRRNGEEHTFEVDPDTMEYHDHGRPFSLLDVALHHGIELEHQCGGNCACTTCHVIVEEGAEHLTELEDDEEDRLGLAPGVGLKSRLGCQSIVQGDVVVRIVD